MHAAPATSPASATTNAPTVPRNLSPRKQRPPLQPGTFMLSYRKLVFVDPAEEPELPGLELPAAVSPDPSPTASADAALAALGTAT
jgi:hypothetical protein